MQPLASSSRLADAAHHTRRISSSTIAFLSQTTIQDLIDFRDSVEPPTPTRAGVSGNAPSLVGAELVAVSTDATLKDAWKLLYLHSIDSIPVWRQVGNAREFTAFLTFLDLAAYTVLDPVFKELTDSVDKVAPESIIDFGFNRAMSERVKDIVTRVVPSRMDRKVSDLLQAMEIGDDNGVEKLYGGSPDTQRVLHQFRTTDNLIDLTDCMRKGAHKVLAVAPAGPDAARGSQVVRLHYAGITTGKG